MSNWVNRNTLEYLLYRNDPDYVNDPDWFIVPLGSSSETLLNTQPIKYLFVPTGQNEVVEKTQGGKDAADAAELAEQQTQARAAAVAYVESTLDPLAMVDRAFGQDSVEWRNEHAAAVSATIRAAQTGTNYGQYRAAQNTQATIAPKTFTAARQDVIDRINSGSVDGPAPEGT